MGASVGALASALLRSAVPGETREMVADGLALGVARDEPKRLSFDLPPGAPVAFPLVRRSQSVLEAAVADEGIKVSVPAEAFGLEVTEAANECKGWCATALHCEQKGNCGGCSFCGGTAVAGDDADVVLVQYRSNPYTHALLPGRTAVAAKIVCEKQQRVRSRVVDVELRRRGEVIQVKGISQPVRIAFAAEEEDGGDSRRLDEAEPCNPLAAALAECDAEAAALAEEQRAKAAGCYELSFAALWDRRAYDECVADANATLTEATAAAERCEAMPKPCSGRGACAADGSCTCDPGWTGGGCESPLKCGWYDGQRRAWSTDGCVPAAPVAGECTGWRRQSCSVCACSHLTSFTLIEAAEEAQAFNSSQLDAFIGSLQLQMPEALEWDRFGVELGRVRPEGWVIWAASLGGLVLLLALAKYADSRGVYRVYMPLWHRILSCGDIDRYRNNRWRRWLVRLPALAVIWYCCSHYILRVVFILPWEELTHQHRMMVFLNVLLAQLNLLLLFWYTYQAFSDLSSTDTFCPLLEGAVTIVITLSSALAFRAATRSRTLHPRTLGRGTGSGRSRRRRAARLPADRRSRGRPARRDALGVGPRGSVLLVARLERSEKYRAPTARSRSGCGGHAPRHRE